VGRKVMVLLDATRRDVLPVMRADGGRVTRVSTARVKADLASVVDSVSSEVSNHGVGLGAVQEPGDTRARGMEVQAPEVIRDLEDVWAPRGRVGSNVTRVRRVSGSRKHLGTNSANLG
jgi:hypothetical protein